MKPESNIKRLLKAFVVIIPLTWLVPSCLAADEVTAKPSAPPATTTAQQTFKTPQEALDSLIKAASAFDVPALKQILGPGSEDLVASNDPVMDKERAQAFAAKATEKSLVTIDPKDSDRANVVVGNDDFPLPIPLVKHKGNWSFDTKGGKQEILYRRIGANELDAIEVCRGYVDAQTEYAAEKHDDAVVNQYAQRIISTAGKHDGLAWQDADGTWKGPIGETVAKAIAQGYQTGKGEPYHGYYFKVLKGQGASAPLGAMDYVVENAMIGGFALAAAPAQYRVTGVKTFIVNQSGVVYEKDLGPDTLKTFQGMDLFDPGKTWRITNDEW